MVCIYMDMCLLCNREASRIVTRRISDSPDYKYTEKQRPSQTECWCGDCVVYLPRGGSIQRIKKRTGDATQKPRTQKPTAYLRTFFNESWKTT